MTKPVLTVRKDAGVAHARVFLPIMKMDAATRTIVARITDETVDLSGEICDYETSAPLFKKWSEKAHKATAGKSKGNLRAMHQPISAGKLSDLVFDDATKAIDCVAKVVDDAEWEKCQEGVYTGLSLGGNYVGKKWKDEATGAWRYTVDPVEVSLVDLPCNPSATFKVTGADGVEVDKAFKPWEPEKADVEAEATRLFDEAGAVAKDAGKGPVDFLEDARGNLIAKRAEVEQPLPDEEPAPAGDEVAKVGEGEPLIEGEPEVVVEQPETDWEIDQVFRCRADGTVHAKKAEAKAHIDDLKAVSKVGGPDLLAAAIEKAKKAAEGAGVTIDQEGEPLVVKVEGLDAAVAAYKAVSLALADNPLAVVKGLYSASRAVDVLESVCSLAACAAWEAEYEGDGSKVPQMIADAARALGAAALAFCQEEIAEAMTQLPEVIDAITITGDGDVIELARTGLECVKANEALVQKAGARNSAADAKRIQAIHDASKGLGADCGDNAEKVQKLAGENEALKARIEGALPQIEAITETVTKLRGELDTTKAELEKVKKAPAPMPTIDPAHKIESRQGDAAVPDLTPETAAKAIAGLVETYGQEKVAQMLVKSAQTRPMA